MACCAALAALALAGCGGSSSRGLTKAQLAGRANALCSAYARAAILIPAPIDFATNASAAAAYLDKAEPLVATEKNGMLALKPDSGAKMLWDQFTAAGLHITRLFDDARAKAHAGQSALTDIEQAAIYKRSTLIPLASQLGAPACAR